MAERNSNNYAVAIVPETEYGTQVKGLTAGGAVYFPDILEWSNRAITVERATKENNLHKMPTRMIVTGQFAVGTLSGDLRDSHEILLKGLFDDASSPYTFANTQPTGLSYNVYQLYLNAAGAITHYDVLLGCAFSPLTITGEANGLIQYSLNIEAASFREEIANAAGDALTATVAFTGSPFLFGNVTYTGASALSALNSFSLELSKGYVDNALRFQNSLTKTNDKYTSVGGTLQVTEIWDTEAFMYKATQHNQYPLPTILTLINPVKTWSMEIIGVLTEAVRPDADRGLFLGNYTFDLTYDPNVYSNGTIITVTTT